ncbi:hypothetical protein PoB_003735300 [Plakobranchus ocellatus]|uniref:Uncharacterized protein n=1 Tax=Plakobranchus ocellatus TaxID=259542 RepID=A0AAV4AVI4_9GAST|nr:hypothetical protein PoB_003735300 [Plakobranchus ocellatus]
MSSSGLLLQGVLGHPCSSDLVGFIGGYQQPGNLFSSLTIPVLPSLFSFSPLPSLHPLSPHRARHLSPPPPPPRGVGGVGGTVASESAQRSAGIFLPLVRVPPSAPRPDREL